jgi:hypothetical protein
MYNINILEYDKVKAPKYHSQNLIKQVAETDAKWIPYMTAHFTGLV